MSCNNKLLNLIKQDTGVALSTINNALNDPNTSPEVIELIKSIFDEVDNVTRNNSIDSKEWNNFVSVFSQVDEDVDGVISEEELNNAP